MGSGKEVRQCAMLSYISKSAAKRARCAMPARCAAPPVCYAYHYVFPPPCLPSAADGARRAEHAAQRLSFASPRMPPCCRHAKTGCRQDSRV